MKKVFYAGLIAALALSASGMIMGIAMSELCCKD